MNQRYEQSAYRNGYAHPDSKGGAQHIQKIVEEAKKQGFDNVIDFTFSDDQRVCRTDYIDKSMHGLGRKSALADKVIGAGIGNDFSNGHRGMAKAVKGAKKFVRTRVRFQENTATRKLTETVREE